MKEVLLNMLSGALETIGESKLIEILQKLHDKSPDRHKAALHAGWLLCSELEAPVRESKSPLDDALILALRDAIQASAVSNGVTL